MTEQDKVPTAMWRVVEAARVALTAMPVHRAGVARVAQVEQALVPAIEAMMPAIDAFAVASEQRKASLALQSEHLDELYRRTQYWLTYVRMDVPGYRASAMQSRADSVKAVLDRAHRLLTVVRAEAEPHDYATQLRAELEPLYERAVRERDEAEAAALELTRARVQVRALMVPVFRNINTLRKLLRNSLGPAHPHVRGLNMLPPKKAKRDTTDSVVELASAPTAVSQPVAPTTAERLALVR